MADFHVIPTNIRLSRKAGTHVAPPSARAGCQSAGRTAKNEHTPLHRSPPPSEPGATAAASGRRGDTEAKLAIQAVGAQEGTHPRKAGRQCPPVTTGKRPSSPQPRPSGGLKQTTTDTAAKVRPARHEIPPGQHTDRRTQKRSCPEGVEHLTPSGQLPFCSLHWSA